MTALPALPSVQLCAQDRACNVMSVLQPKNMSGHSNSDSIETDEHARPLQRWYTLAARPVTKLCMRPSHKWRASQLTQSCQLRHVKAHYLQSIVGVCLLPGEHIHHCSMYKTLATHTAGCIASVAGLAKAKLEAGAPRSDLISQVLCLAQNFSCIG